MSKMVVQVRKQTFPNSTYGDHKNLKCRNTVKMRYKMINNQMLKIPKVSDQSELIMDNCTDRINMVYDLELSAEANHLRKSSWIVRI